MKSMARIAIVACFGGLSCAGFWWFFGQLGNPFGFPGVSTVPPWLVGISAGVLAGCGEAWRVVIERRDARKNREIAERLGCKITEYVPAVEIRSMPQVSPFRNDSPCGSNRMTGTHNGRQIDVFDFQYTVTSHGSGEGSSSSTSTYIQTVYRFPRAAQEWPRFLLKPRRRLIGFLSSMMGETEAELSLPADSTDERIAMFEEFQKRYQITVPDGAAFPGELQRLFHPFVVGWLALHPGWSMESKDGDLVAWKSDSRAVGAERLRMLDELGDLLSLMAAADSALERVDPAQIEIRAHDRARGVSSFMGLWLGAMIGSAAGATLGGLIVSQVFASMPEVTPKFPVVVPLFFGCPIAFAVLGGYLGLRLGRRSEWGRRLAKRIDPRPAEDSNPNSMTDAG